MELNLSGPRVGLWIRGAKGTDFAAPWNCGPDFDILHSMRRQRLFTAALAIALLAGVTACALPDAARRSSETLKEGWDFEANGLRVLYTGPGATVMAAGDLALYSMRPARSSSAEPEVKWFRFYDGPMRPQEEIAILCHLDSATHISSIRGLADPVAVAARYEPWHYPACIEATPGEYEITVSYYSRKTVEQDLSATTTTSESTTDSTTQWDAQPGAVYVLAAVIGKPATAPGKGPTYKPRRRTKELWDTTFMLEVSHWKAAIVQLPETAQLDLPIKAHREIWRQHEGRR
jgi:hypothetical protein